MGNCIDHKSNEQEGKVKRVSKIDRLNNKSIFPFIFVKMFIQPKINLSKFNCPHCGTFAQQIWSTRVDVHYNERGPDSRLIDRSYELNFKISQCVSCSDSAIWNQNSLIYLITGSVEIANSDMPENIKEDYNEAKNIVNLSSRGAAALLRLSLQKLCVHLGGTGKNINDDIKKLVSNGLPKTMQQALDSVRVIGNNAVHPGQIDIKDDIETANKLFGFINVICEMLITQPNRIDKFYTENLPEKDRNNIDARDS